MGIGDRHPSNLLLRDDGNYLHIDFGHFLGHFKTKLGIKRETAPFVFTHQFAAVLGGSKRNSDGELVADHSIVIMHGWVFSVSFEFVMLDSTVSENSE